MFKGKKVWVGILAAVLVPLLAILGSVALVRAQDSGVDEHVGLNSQGGIDEPEGQNEDIEDGAVGNVDEGAVGDIDDGAVGNLDDGAVANIDDGAAGDVDDGIVGA